MDIRRLIERVAEEEEAFENQKFVAPAVANAKVRARVAGMVSTFSTRPRDFEGWGVFQASGTVARLVRPASLPQVEAYLSLLKPLHLRLVYRLTGRTWLAYPAQEGDAHQRFGRVEPVPVSLVEEGNAFEQVVARFDGAHFWFEKPDRRASPRQAERMRQALTEGEGEIRWAGVTPEMKTAYEMVVSRLKLFTERRDEDRLQEALLTGGGELLGYADREDYWVVEWRDSSGMVHNSAIAKQNMTVLTAGICLSGEDEKFDLQSLVGVVEKAEDWAFE